MMGLDSALRALQVVWVACGVGGWLARCVSATPNSANVIGTKKRPSEQQGWQEPGKADGWVGSAATGGACPGATARGVGTKGFPSVPGQARRHSLVLMVHTTVSSKLGNPPPPT